VLALLTEIALTLQARTVPLAKANASDSPANMLAFEELSDIIK